VPKEKPQTLPRLLPPDPLAQESAMKVPAHPTLIRRMCLARVQKLAAAQPVLAASLVHKGKRCGRAGCRCERGQKHRSWFLTYKHDGKTKTVYVPLDMVQEVRSWIEEHRRMKKLAQEIRELAIAWVKTYSQSRRRRANGS